MTWRWLAMTCALAAAGGGCGSCSCSSDRAVPFKRGSSQAAERADGGSGLAIGDTRSGASYPTGTLEVELDNQKLRLSAGSIRAALDVDLDGDDKRDALLLSEDEAGAPTLLRALRGADGWEPPVAVRAFAASDEHCAYGSAQLDALDSDYALAQVDLRCGEPPALPAGQPGEAGPSPPDPPAPSPPAPTSPVAAAPAPGATAAPAPAPSPAQPAGTAPATVSMPVFPAPPPHARRVLWVIALESPPRVLERIVLPASDDASGPKLDAALAAGDLDGDGHSDLQLTLEVAAPELATTHVVLKLWNRAGGLARDRAEPEQTLLALADQAKSERKKKPAAAALLARQALVAYDALCRESGSARLGSDDGQGLECGASLAAGRAGSVLAAILAGEGKLLEALARYEALRSPALRLTENDWERVRSALQAKVEHGFSWREGPSVAIPPGSAARSSLVAFLDEHHVLLRGTSPRSYDLGTGTAQPIGVQGSTVIMDPSARFALSGVSHGCEGDKLGIVRVAQIVEGVVAGPPVSEPLITAANPGTPCTASAPARDEHSAFRPLSWTREGVLLARGAELWLLPLDGTAQASGPAQRVQASAAPPAETYSGEVSSDGRLHAIVTPLGIALLERASGRARLIALPDAPGSTPSDVALSPSGKALAIVRDGRLFVGVPSEGTTTTPAPGAVPPVPAQPAAPPAMPAPAAPAFGGGALREPPPSP